MIGMLDGYKVLYGLDLMFVTAHLLKSLRFSGAAEGFTASHDASRHAET